MKRILAALASLALSAPAVAAPFESTAGMTYFDVNTDTHRDTVIKLWEAAQFAEPLDCHTETSCTQDVYALYEGQVYYMVADIENGHIDRIGLYRNGPLNRSIFYHGYFQNGTYMLNENCDIQMEVMNEYTGEIVIEEVTPLAPGYICPR